MYAHRKALTYFARLLTPIEPEERVNLLTSLIGMCLSKTGMHDKKLASFAQARTAPPCV